MPFVVPHKIQTYSGLEPTPGIQRETPVEARKKACMRAVGLLIKTTVDFATLNWPTSRF
jgi:hypothetical protein